MELTSAQGRYLKTPSSGAFVRGARSHWLDVDHNHNHGRFNVHAATTIDRFNGRTFNVGLGQYIGVHGHGLPQSARNLTAEVLP